VLDIVDIVSAFQKVSTESDQAHLLWQLCKGDEVFTCAVRLTPAGLRLEQSIGDQRLVSQTYQTEDELYRHVNVVRRQCLEDGWTEDGWTEDG
jgi:hypothetical protein